MTTGDIILGLLVAAVWLRIVRDIIEGRGVWRRNRK